jgi:hypothetical protein
MAGSPKYKVYSPSKEYIASCKHAEGAACLVGMYGDGSTVRLGHGPIIWSEGAEDFSGGNSYDGAAAVMHEREQAINQRGYDRAYGKQG